MSGTLPTRIALLLIVALLAFTGCGSDGPRYEVKRLDPEGDVWWIFDHDAFAPMNAIGQTCATVGRRVAEVKITHPTDGAIVRCGDVREGSSS